MDDVSPDELRVQFDQEIQTLKVYVSSSLSILVNTEAAFGLSSHSHLITFTFYWLQQTSWCLKQVSYTK